MSEFVNTPPPGLEERGVWFEISSNAVPDWVDWYTAVRTGTSSKPLPRTELELVQVRRFLRPHVSQGTGSRLTSGVYMLTGKTLRCIVTSLSEAHYGTSASRSPSQSFYTVTMTVIDADWGKISTLAILPLFPDRNRWHVKVGAPNVVPAGTSIGEVDGKRDLVRL